MQGAILAELEDSYERSRKYKDNTAASGSVEDLLVPNPNHAPTDSDEVPQSGESDDEDSE